MYLTISNCLKTEIYFVLWHNPQIVLRQSESKEVLLILKLINVKTTAYRYTSVGMYVGIGLYPYLCGNVCRYWTVSIPLWECM
jgi:hypothetical protein